MNSDGNVVIESSSVGNSSSVKVGTASDDQAKVMLTPPVTVLIC